MSYTTTELITGAYYASGVVSREFETVSGTQQSDGLVWLNNIITETNVADGMIPYETTYNFNAQPGVEKYFIPGIVGIDTVVFYIQNVRFSLQYEKRNAYFGSPRVQSINSLPFEWYFERAIGGGNLYIYFQPDTAYPMEIHGYFELPPVELGQDLTINNTQANLGIPTIYGDGVLNTGELVINNIDLAGSYATVGDLVNYINTGVIPNVSASVVINDLIISSNTNPPVPIYIRTSGMDPVISTRGTMVAASTANLNATYANGTAGVNATLTNAGAMAALSLDSVAMAVGDRVLIKDQTSTFQNGIYIVSVVGSGAANWVLTRATNYDTAGEIQPGNLVFVDGGTVQADTYWEQTEEVLVMGTDPIVFDEFESITFSNFSLLGVANYQIFNQRGFDEFYITFLRYALADRICSEYNFVVPSGVTKQLDYYRGLINKESKVLDLQLKKHSTLQKDRQTFGWAYVNVGRGWVPSR